MKKLAFFIFVATLASAVSALAQSGGYELGNGGDLVAQEFTAAGRQLVAELRKKPDPRIPDVDAFARVVDETKVNTAESLTLHGAEVDAINFPEERHIDVSRSRWREYSPGKRASLVLHEYLGVSRVNDQHYEISGAYADAFVGDDEKPKKWEAQLNTGYGVDLKYNGLKTDRPSVGVFLGYDLSLRSTVGLSFQSQRFSRTYDIAEAVYTTTVDTIDLSLLYRYWLAEKRPFRPYVTVGAGAAYFNSSDSIKVGQDSWSNQILQPRDSWGHWNPEMNGSLGAQWAFHKNFALDLSANFHEEFGFTYKFFKHRSARLFGQLGISTMF